MANSLYTIKRRIGKQQFIKNAARYVRKKSDLKGSLDDVVDMMETTWYSRKNFVTVADKMIADYNRSPASFLN